MSACPHIESCVLRRSIGMQAALRVWQSFYCDGAYARCERYKLAASGAEVPSRLLPNGRLLEGPEAMRVPREVHGDTHSH
jgi:hypothetical protein